MRHIDRLTKPQILQERGNDWTQSFVNERSKNPSRRPDSSKYRHSEILECLEQMSAHKCFYCEKLLSREESQVDHHVEIAIAPERAFDWNNLYLACKACNGKSDHNKIPVDQTLDPCMHQDHEIERHLTFEENLIYSRDDSELGHKSIQKYKLNNEHLNYLRLEAINRFKNLLIAVLTKMKEDGREHPNDLEKEKLQSFANRDKSYSLMFKILLKKYSLVKES